MAEEVKGTWVTLENLGTFWENAHKEDITSGEITKSDGVSTIQIEENEDGTKKIKINVEDERYSNSTATLNAVGGVKAGTTFDNLTVQQIFDMLFYPHVDPVVSVTANPNGGTFEMGNNQTITAVNVNVTKKSDDISKIEVFNGDSSLGSKTDGVASGGTFSFDVSVPVNSTNVQLTVKVTDARNAVVEKKTNSFSFYYPFYHGVVEDVAGSLSDSTIQATSKKIEGKGQKSYSFTTNNNRAMIAYPASYGSLSKITDGSGVTDYTNSFDRAEISLSSSNPEWGPVSYYVYTSGKATATNFTYIFRF